eukprot:c13908_g1_i1.p1 GENE.c13908_g1_i1~~c13908_g1_i1.p1  ORF type:complete len:353 (+),score=71.85 c13908_g1_i1:34-1059(+)
MADDVCLFEGVEKTLVVGFSLPHDHTKTPNNLRSLSKETWVTILAECGCTILGEIHSDKMDAYLLSESSLFVFETKCIFKTCGRTKLLTAVGMLQDLALFLDARVSFVNFCRSSFMYPSLQPSPHTSFADEIDFLACQLNTSRESLGVFESSSKHHTGESSWYMCIFDPMSKIPSSSALHRSWWPRETVIELRMHDLPSHITNCFIYSNRFSPESQSLRTQMLSLLPEFQIDEYDFQPCGYSFNALKQGGYYATVHVTPETSGSYISFETNFGGSLFAAKKTVARLLQLLEPSTAVVVLFAEDRDLSVISNEFAVRSIEHHTFPGQYKITVANLMTPTPIL